MPIPQFGSIIVAEVRDPQNSNLKRRPVVIVTPTDKIKAGIPFWDVAVTTQVPSPITDEFVILPFDPTGAARTGLRNKCAAKCDWPVELSHGAVLDYLGVAPKAAMIQITEYLAAHDDY